MQVFWQWTCSAFIYLKKFTSTWVLKNAFTGYRILGWQLFSYSILRDVIRSTLTCLVSDQKSLLILIFVYLYLFPPLVTFKISLFITSFQQFDYDVPLLCFLNVYVTVFSIHWASCLCVFVIFIKFGQYSAIISSGIFSVSSTPSFLLRHQLLLYYFILQVTGPLVFPPHPPHFFIHLLHFAMVSCSVIFSSAVSNLLLISSCEIIIAGIGYLIFD